MAIHDPGYVVFAVDQGNEYSQDCVEPLANHDPDVVPHVITLPYK